MNMIYFTLILSLSIILLGAGIFTNSIEWLGKKLHLSEGTIGSILAAIGTALPETMISLIAIIFGTSKESSQIGIGTILGAPLMLATLAMMLVGIAATFFKIKGQPRQYLFCNPNIIKKDLFFFLLVYSLAMCTAFFPSRPSKIIVAIFLVLLYLYYAYHTIKSGKSLAEIEILPLIFNRKNATPSLQIILLQIIFSLGTIIGGAHLFIQALTQISLALKVPAFILAIIITPIATELPEKFNSIIWIKQGKDTLALGNITGAMVFQSSVIPALGIFLTPWELSFLALASGILALLSASIIYYHLHFKNKLKPRTLIRVGYLYLAFFLLVIYTRATFPY
jgi:cation:H+ antiporter